MSNTITLPDHISFEEIAAKWCYNDDEVIRAFPDRYEFVYFGIDGECCCEAELFSKTVGIFYFDSRKFCFSNDTDYESLRYVVSFIKERSNV